MSNEKKFVITEKFENVFGGDDIELQNQRGVEYFDVSWRIRIFPQGLQFCMDLDCFVNPDYIKWAMDAEIEWKLLSDNGWKRVKKSRYKIKKNENPGISFDWRCHADCFSMDSLVVECHVEIIEMNGFGRKSLRRFDQSTADVSDLVIVVDSERFYVCKNFLSAQSNHFRTLISEDPNRARHSEIVLEDIDPLEFQYFLEVLYGHRAEDDNTVVSILKLAEKFETPTVLEQCERYLLLETDMDALKELELAVEFKLDRLKSSCLDEMETIEDILKMMPADPSQLSPPVMALILQKMLSLW